METKVGRGRFFSKMRVDVSGESTRVPGKGREEEGEGVGRGRSGEKGGEKFFIEQQNIDGAFKNLPRITRNVPRYNGYRLCILNGMSTGELGAIDLQIPAIGMVRVTGIERTLIDIAVRPFYSGGVACVLNAYRRARGEVSIEKLVTILKEINYMYPYHQAIGFYLEKAGYERNSLRVLKDLGLNYDFYLANQITSADFLQEWRIFFPSKIR